MSDAHLADLIVVIHAAYVAFVLVGQILILIGIWRHWSWVRNRWFRVAHFAAILIVAGEALLDIPCPLTTWETELRQRAGQSVEGGMFIGRLVHDALFIEAPAWAFNSAYIGFALLVAATMWWAPPNWKPKS